jgi:hypothetical protein
MIDSSFCGRWKLEIEQEGRALGKEHANKQTAVKGASSDSSFLGFECRLVKVGLWRWGNSEDDVVSCMCVQYV